MSCLPDPRFHAYRKDLADTALAGLVIASHYAEPLIRRVIGPAALCATPAAEAEIIAKLAEGEPFRMLDSTRGWAWGYAADGRVGYVDAEAISA